MRGTSDRSKATHRKHERQAWARKVADAHPNPAAMTVAELAAAVEMRVAEVVGK